MFSSFHESDSFLFEFTAAEYESFLEIFQISRWRKIYLTFLSITYNVAFLIYLISSLWVYSFISLVHLEVNAVYRKMYWDNHSSKKYVTENTIDGQSIILVISSFSSSTHHSFSVRKKKTQRLVLKWYEST